LKPETPLICAVEQLAYYLENFSVKIVIKVESHFLDEVTYAFEKTSIKERVSKMTIYIKYYFFSAFLNGYWWDV
jgi:hypothetical protein